MQVIVEHDGRGMPRESNDRVIFNIRIKAIANFPCKLLVFSYFVFLSNDLIYANLDKDLLQLLTQNPIVEYRGYYYVRVYSEKRFDGLIPNLKLRCFNGSVLFEREKHIRELCDEN